MVRNFVRELTEPPHSGQSEEEDLPLAVSDFWSGTIRHLRATVLRRKTPVQKKLSDNVA